MATNRERKSASQRIRQAALAGLIALVIAFLSVFEFVDQLTWLTQSRMASFKASGEIVYVGARDDLTDPAFPQRRKQLAETLDLLKASGAERVYVDMVFDRPSDAEADSELNAALRAFNGDAFLVRKMETNLNGEVEPSNSVPAVSNGVAGVGSLRWRNYLGYTWAMPFSISYRDEEIANLPTAIAGIDPSADYLISGSYAFDLLPNPTHNLSGAQFPINYALDLSTVPTYQFRDTLASPGPMGTRQVPEVDVSGKVVVIGNSNRSVADSPNIPGHTDVPSSMVAIFAAETLLAGHTQMINGFVVLIATLLALCLIGQIAGSRLRHTLYGVIPLALTTAIYVTAQLGMKIMVADACVLLVTYGILRARANLKNSLRLVDPDTGLPAFAALEADKVASETVPAIIVAKIHRFEEVRKTLPAELHSEYLLRIIGRLKAARQDVRIYVGPGHLIAWTFPEKEPALVREHLEGLRALFSSPLLVGDNQVDVGITFGVDITPSPSVTKRLAAAVEAAERTTETYEPIEIAEMANDEDLIWNISLQARIDAALANGEIYLIYQPKILVQSGELVGVEALVRWRDPVKGLIPPDHFIRQCENAGRMSHLTRHVLTEACKAGIAFEDRGLNLPIAVNISATLVHERDIITMVREVLAETHFDPRRLTLEITETYRISNFERASQILADLAALGPKISMDDFGVGAASLEALQRLPFSELKIDRTFIAEIKDDPKSAGIVRNVLQLGKDLRIIVVAEGVEDDATLQILRESECLVAQGFGISRPVSFEEILKFKPKTAIGMAKNVV